VKPPHAAPYFVFATLVHVAAIASRFDVVAARLPPDVPLAIMVAQFPLLMLSGFFEGQLDYGPPMSGFPRWMQIRSRPVKLATTFGFIYLCCVTLQTWHVSIGPINPTPPAEWPTAQRAAWFAMFTAGMFFPFYLAAASLVIPTLRVLTAPLRAIPVTAIGAVLALAVGFAAGLGVCALTTWTKLGAVVDQIQAAIAENGAVAIAVTAALTFGPMLVGLVVKRRDDRDA
jgi:hypothetical protein